VRSSTLLRRLAAILALTSALFLAPTPASQHPAAETTRSGGSLTWYRLGDQEYYVYVPQPDGSDEPYRLLVSIHGASRNAKSYAERFVDFADHNRYIVVAPYFVEEHRFGDLGLGASLYRSDLRLLEVIAEVRKELPVEAGPFDLFGFSGGGQFAHRFLYVHPAELRTVVVGATVPGAPTWRILLACLSTWPR
jgi:poly(3-hydroxybutyrate) depolymerase